MGHCSLARQILDSYVCGVRVPTTDSFGQTGVKTDKNKNTI